MYFVYIIYSKVIERFYVGFSEDLERRLEAHNKGISTYTKRGIPWELIYKLGFNSKREALEMELKIKKRGAKRFLEDIKFGM